MIDCFISFSTFDKKLATFVHNQLTRQNVSVFLAPISMRPGMNWTSAIWSNLKQSKWVLFLASKAACQSPFVQQEIGCAISESKRIIPICWNMDPSNLPGWLNRIQALDLRGRTYEDLAHHLRKIASDISADKQKGALIAGAFLTGLIVLALKE
jgi:hypothetical protein